MTKANMVIAVDFDGTLCEHEFPEIGEPKQRIINYIKAEKEKGATIVLWTCREDIPERNYLAEAIEWCKAHDIPIDNVNEYTLPEFHGFASRKVCADIYIDDKALNVADI